MLKCFYLAKDIQLEHRLRAASGGKACWAISFFKE